MNPAVAHSFGTFEINEALAYLAWPKLKYIFHNNESGQKVPDDSASALLVQ
jgi:hypothetical protein